MPNDYQHWGTIRRAKGVEGRLIIERILPDLSAPEAHHFWIPQKGCYIPYRIARLKLEEESTYATLQLKQVDSREEAKQLLHKKLYTLPDAAIEADLRRAGWHLIGYRVETPEGKRIGEITAIIPRAMQALIELKTAQKRERFIPYHEELFTLNERGRILIVEEKDIS